MVKCRNFNIKQLAPWNVGSCKILLSTLPRYTPFLCEIFKLFLKVPWRGKFWNINSHITTRWFPSFCFQHYGVLILFLKIARVAPYRASFIGNDIYDYTTHNLCLLIWLIISTVNIDWPGRDFLRLWYVLTPNLSIDKF